MSGSFSQQFQASVQSVAKNGSIASCNLLGKIAPIISASLLDEMEKEQKARHKSSQI
jgi:hypothetical protein